MTMKVADSLRESAPTRGASRPLSLAGSYAYCERLARREAGNFYHAFRLLPADQRRAMCTSIPSCAWPTTWRTAPVRPTKNAARWRIGGGDSTRRCKASLAIRFIPLSVTPSAASACRPPTSGR